MYINFKMARYRRTRRYRRRSSRWSSNLLESQGIIDADPGTFYYAETLMLNPIQDINTVSQVYTVKNVEISFTIEFPHSSNDYSTSLEDITAYIMYVPQGMQVTGDYNIQHPEYIMNYKYLGSPTHEPLGQQYQPYKLRSRLARKLNTGDNIILFIKGINQRDASLHLKIGGVVRWWTKSN